MGSASRRGCSVTPLLPGAPGAHENAASARGARCHPLPDQPGGRRGSLAGNQDRPVGGRPGGCRRLNWRTQTHRGLPHKSAMRLGSKPMLSLEQRSAGSSLSCPAGEWLLRRNRGERDDLVIVDARHVALGSFKPLPGVLTRAEMAAADTPCGSPQEWTTLGYFAADANGVVTFSGPLTGVVRVTLITPMECASTVIPFCISIP